MDFLLFVPKSVLPAREIKIYSLIKVVKVNIRAVCKKTRQEASNSLKATSISIETVIKLKFLK